MFFELHGPMARITDMATQGRVLAFVSILVTAGSCALAQPLDESPGRLPTPTGVFGVGRVTLLCEDASRIEPLDSNANSRRIMVDVWYPAEPSALKASSRAEYLNVVAFERALGADGLKNQLGGSYDVIKAGGVMTHAVAQAPFASTLRLAPVLLFSPGGGMIRELYTFQMEDLASHGYVVAALTHSYDGFLTVFPDGSYIAYDSRRWPKIPSFEGEANLNQLEWHTDDILVVLNQLSRLNGAPSSQLPFAGRLDLTRVGAFGHSFGGIAVAHACQRDQRIMACLNQDGAMGMKPFYLDVQGWGMNQAFMLIERPPNREPLTDADLAAMKVTRARAMEIVGRLNADRDRALRSTGMGSYRVLLRRSVTTHTDFSDLQVLSARDTAERNQRMPVLMFVRSYTLAFFDKHVRDIKAPLLDRSAPDQLLESIERFGPAKRPN
jgi:hypothetical protein